jgi:hypothetical protein
MLFSPVLASSHFRIPSRPSPALLGRASNSHEIISFADPHPLTLLESYRFKNIRGWGSPPTGKARNAQNPVVHLSFFSSTYKMLLAQPFSFDGLPFSWGGVPPSSDSQSPFPRPLSPISFFFISLRTLLHLPKSQLFCSQTVPHSLRKTPGVGGGATC